MYIENIVKDSITKIHTISHLHLQYFINCNVLNAGSLIDLYNDPFSLRIVWVSNYDLNTLVNLMRYFKTWEQEV